MKLCETLVDKLRPAIECLTSHYTNSRSSVSSGRCPHDGCWSTYNKCVNLPPIILIDDVIILELESSALDRCISLMALWVPQMTGQFWYFTSKKWEWILRSHVNVGVIGQLPLIWPHWDWVRVSNLIMHYISIINTCLGFTTRTEPLMKYFMVQISPQILHGENSLTGWCNAPAHTRRFPFR